MDGELIFWVLLPMIVAIIAMVVSLLTFVRHPGIAQGLLMLVVLIGLGWAAWRLQFQLRGSWPTFLPHFVMLPVLPLVVYQIQIARKKPTA